MGSVDTLTVGEGPKRHRWGYIPMQGCSNEEVYRALTEMAACAVLDKKVEHRSQEYYSQHGENEKDGFRRQGDQIRST